MNGQEQKERATAVAKLERELKALGEATQDCWTVELEERQKADSHLQDMFAKMLDDETGFRRLAIQKAENNVRSYVAKVDDELTRMLRTFMLLPFYKRWGWVIFGHSWLIWTAPKSFRQDYAHARKVERAARQASAMAPPEVSQEQLRKQQSYTERPQ